MEFDKSRVYTALNADELKIGSKVIVANSIGKLQQKVNTMEYEQVCEVITWIGGEDHEFRFCISGEAYLLAYLVEEPKEHSLKWTDLNIGDVVRNKYCNLFYAVTGIDTKDSSGTHIHLAAYNKSNSWLTDEELKDWELVMEKAT